MAGVGGVTEAGRARMHRPYSPSALITLPTAWLCPGRTFAISLSPLAPARQRAQATAFLTFGLPLADRAGQGAARLLRHV